MKTSLFVFLIVLGFSFLPGQTDLPARFYGGYPDFGAVQGSWGHLQQYRPFGLRGIILENWQDLTGLNPISGEIFNTDRQGWLPLGEDRSLWAQLHPSLTAPADTVAPSLLVNYKQGEAEFNDFTFWYHNSLGSSTRYGWTSKLRSHQKFLAVTAYDEQRHRAQIESQLKASTLRLELGYSHQINPLYMYELDTLTQVLNYNDDLQLNSDRWDGNLYWQSNDSSRSNSGIFASIQGGLWDWKIGKRQSISYLAYLDHEFKLGNLPVLSLKLGGMSKQLGNYKIARQFVDLMLPGLQWKNIELALGLRSAGFAQWLPVIDARIDLVPFQLTYQTRQLVFERVWDPRFKISNIHHLQAFYKGGWLVLKAGAWRTAQNNQTSAGYHGRAHLELPWKMQLMVEGSRVFDPFDWVWARQQVVWELNQDVILFEGALFGHLKIWGRHLIGVRTGVLDPETLAVTGFGDSPAEDITHLLNYTISGQVSTLILAYTDSNILQDPVWSQYAAVPWKSEYLIMNNQQPETRFRYLSLIWVFDN